MMRNVSSHELAITITTSTFLVLIITMLMMAPSFIHIYLEVSFFRRNISNCQTCTPGWYCGGDGLAEPTNKCSQGYYCVSGAKNDTQHQCPPGYYCPTGSADKRPCESGTYQNEWGKWTCKTCPAGYYCNATYGPVSIYASYECPPGYYCPLGTKFNTEHACGLGTFLNRTKGESATDCIPCIGKFACDSTGLVNPWRLCASGYYCRRGVNTTTPRAGKDGDQCPPGRYCPEGETLIFT